MTIRIHSHPLSGHAHRVVLFAALAGIPYEIVFVDLLAGEQKQVPFLKLNPYGEVPVIEDGETVISDSNAILIYLARKYAPSFLPSDPVKEAETQKFLTLATSELVYGPAHARACHVFKRETNLEQAHFIAANLFTKLERHLEYNEFLVGGAISIADVSMYTYTAHAPEGKISLEPYPNICRFLKSIEAQQGFLAMKKTEV